MDKLMGLDLAKAFVTVCLQLLGVDERICCLVAIPFGSATFALGLVISYQHMPVSAGVLQDSRWNWTRASARTRKNMRLSGTL